MTTHYNYRKLGIAFALAAALGMTGQAAQASVFFAPVISTSVINATSPPGGQASPLFVFTFGSDFDLAGFDIKFKFDSTKLSFDYGTSTLAVSGGLVTMPATFIPVVLQGMQSVSPDFESSASAPASVDDAGFNFRIVGAYIDPANFVPTAEGTTITMTGVFNMLPGFDSGATEVRVFGSADGVDFTSEGFNVSASVTAVPEPETWLMLLGGLGLIATRVRRRSQ